MKKKNEKEKCGHQNIKINKKEIERKKAVTEILTRRKKKKKKEKKRKGKRKKAIFKI